MLDKIFSASGVAILVPIITITGGIITAYLTYRYNQAVRIMNHLEKRAEEQDKKIDKMYGDLEQSKKNYFLQSEDLIKLKRDYMTLEIEHIKLKQDNAALEIQLLDIVRKFLPEDQWDKYGLRKNGLAYR